MLMEQAHCLTSVNRAEGVHTRVVVRWCCARGRKVGSDFTVIIDQRQHFGNDADSLPGAFVGNNNNYEFRCPRVDPDQPAVLLFQTLSVDHDKNFIAINSIGTTGQPEVFGGIPVSRSNMDWTGNVMLVRPG